MVVGGAGALEPKQAAANGTAKRGPNDGQGGAKPAKKAKKVKERRENQHGATVRYKSKPSIKDLERMDRALSRGMGASHRMYLIERKDLEPPGSEGGAKATFVVLGATKNVYEVTVGRHLRCSCRDAAKGNVCKHQLFVMLRVLKLSKDNPAVWQRALLTAEADEALASQGACDQDALVSKHYKQKYKRATAGTSADDAEADAGVGPPEGDCPICYEDMADSNEPTEACTTCKHHVHKECMRAWMSRKDQAHQLACVLCRAPWTNDEGEEMTVGVYLNLAGSTTHKPNLDELYGATARYIRHDGCCPGAF